MPEVYVNHIHLHYQCSGSGHPLLLISGVGYGGWFWQRIVGLLDDRYQLIVPDPRGSGETDKPAGPYAVRTLAEDMAGMLDRLKIRGAFVVGHALGAYVAQELALSRPELVAKLVLAAGDFGGPNVIPITEEAYEAITEREGPPRELLERAIGVSVAPGFAETAPDVIQELVDYRMSGAVPAEAYQAQVAAGIAMVAPEASFESRLDQLQMPTLILAGEHDQVVPPANAELLAAKIPGAQVKILPGTGHLFPIEDPEATAAELTAFLGGRKYR